MSKKRIDLRVAPELLERTDKLARELETTRTDITEKALWSYVLSEKIVRCPKCQAALFHIEDVPMDEGIGVYTCRFGHQTIYDFGQSKIIPHPTK